MKWSVPQKKPPVGTIDLTRQADGTVQMKVYGADWTYHWPLTDEQRRKLIHRLQRFDDPDDGGAERRRGPRRLA